MGIKEWKIEIEEKKLTLFQQIQGKKVEFQLKEEGETSPIFSLKIPVEGEEEGELLRKELLIQFFKKVRFNPQIEWEKFKEEFLGMLPQLQQQYRLDLEIIHRLEEEVKNYLKNSDDLVKGIGIVKEEKGKQIKIISLLENNFSIEENEVEQIIQFILFSNRKVTPIKGKPCLTIVEIGDLFYFFKKVGTRWGIVLITLNSRLGIFLKGIESIQSRLTNLLQR